MTKAGIIKAIKTGKLSATKDQRGQWVIEPVELFRVYAPVDSSTQQPESTGSRQDTPEDTASLQAENKLLREWVDDLRARLDSEAEERRRLSLLLTDSQSARRSWWARLWGRSE